MFNFSKPLSKIPINKTVCLHSLAVFGIALMLLTSVPEGFGQTQSASGTEDQSLVQITCSLATGFGVVGNFTQGSFPFGNFTPGQGFPYGQAPDNGTFIFGQPPSGMPNNSNGGYFNFTPGYGEERNFTFPPGDNVGFPIRIQSSLMNVDDYSDLAAVANVVVAVPVLRVVEGQQPISSNPGQSFFNPSEAYTIVGVPLDAHIISSCQVLPTNITAGRNLQAGDDNAVILSESNAELFGATAGDTVTILTSSFNVVGIHGETSIMDNDALYMSLSDAQTLTNNTGKASSIEVFALSQNAETVAGAIRTLHPELSVVVDQQDQQGSFPILTTGADTSTSPQSTATTEASTDQSSSIDFTGVIVAGALVAVIVVVVVFVLRKRQGNPQKMGDVQEAVERPSDPFS